MATTPQQKKRFLDALDAGYNVAEAADKAKISHSTAYRFMAKVREATAQGTEPEVALEVARDPLGRPSQTPSSGAAQSYRDQKREAGLSGAIPYERLKPEAKRALEDFGYFRQRYMGRVPTPWQVQAAVEIRQLLESDQKEYVVINCPPSVGKTTLLHDIICWLICRNRAVRLLLGSATMNQAKKSLNRVRRTLERTTPQPGRPDYILRGLEVDAEATLAQDFGRFKPLDREQWTAEAFIVIQHDELSIAEKESTLQAYGMDANYLGDRVDGCFWDDLVDPVTTRSPTLREQLEERWSDIAESRLEPAGLMVLMGQRIAGDDLYRHCMDLVQPLDLEDEDALEMMTEEERAQVRRDKKYRAIIYRAHYEDLCRGTSDNPDHHPSGEPYPGGCLLDPRRLTWRNVRELMANRGNRFQVMYQQEDVAPDDVFVEPDWIFGSPEHPGCIDKERDRWELPVGLNPSECMAVVTADPSPTNYWAVELWLYAPKFNQRILIDLHRQKMEVGDFLDYLVAEQRYIGLMEDWREAANRLGIPIEYWIWERNAAQRFYLQFDLVKKWASMNSIEILAHDTSGRSKPDEDLGVSSIREHYKFGRVRLPGRGEGKLRAMKLIEEVTKYGHFRTDDCVMAHWFFEWNLDRLHRPARSTTHAWRPTWVRPQRVMAAR